MTPDEIRATVLRVLCRIAPEVDPAQLEPGVSLRDQLDIDSMDYLNFMIGLHKELGIDIPEKDYPQLATLDSCIAYLRVRHMGCSEAISEQTP
jgi:acyl carrier protein